MRPSYIPRGDQSDHHAAAPSVEAVAGGSRAIPGPLIQGRVRGVAFNQRFTGDDAIIFKHACALVKLHNLRVMQFSLDTEKQGI